MSASIRLHLGCGAVHLDGYVNIDRHATEATDRTGDACELKDFADESIDEIATFHMIEHLSELAAYRAACEWFRVLRPGGRIVVECPNLRACCEALATATVGELEWRTAYAGIYGFVVRTRPDGTLERSHNIGHRWGWVPETLIAMLAVAGFAELEQLPAMRHIRWRDMRVEGVKP